MPSASLPAHARTDALSRRLRFSAPNPLVRRLVLTEADYLIFEAIDRHGPLPTHYLYEFTKHLRRDFTHLQNRLTEFYNGDQVGGKAGSYLNRPPRQFAGFEARYQHMVYDLAPRAKAALAERGTLARHSLRCGGPFLHQLMSACVGASLEVAARDAGVRYIAREEIISHPKCRKPREALNPMAIPLPGADQRTLIPDDLFGFQYSGGGFRFFAIEIDRCSESIESNRRTKNSFSAKIAGYQQILAQGAHTQWWGIPNLTVLTVTTNRTHAANLIDYIRRQDQYLDRFAFAVEPSFGANWRVPKHILADLLHLPWATAAGAKDIGKA
ncbi:MAG: replication-relaxation family protein [Burkholderiales bacterium]